MILVDTTVWIDFLNGIDSEKTDQLTLLLKQQTEICITEIIVAEILQGIRNDKEFLETKNSLTSLPFLHAKGVVTYIHAAEIYRQCRKNGKTIRKTIDCILAAIALENNASFLHNDSDFTQIAEIVPLILY
jgi:predicted nucleic acid-binding protein